MEFYYLLGLTRDNLIPKIKDRKGKAAMFEIRYSAQARQFLRKANKADADRIRAKIEQYAEAPDSLKNQIKRLQGLPYYRLRVGDYRVIFNETGAIMKIEKIGKRGDVYRGV